MILIIHKQRLGILKQIMLCMWLICCVMSNAQSQNRFSKVTEYLKANVVAIQVNFSDGKESDGFGFIVGEKNNLLYMVTAGHLNHSNGLTVQKIKLKFYNYDNAEAKEVQWFEVYDLSLLSCPKPPGMSWNPKFANFSPVAFDKVTSIGKNQNWDIPGVGDINSISNHWINFTMGALEPGCSGSPLITEKGIVGMIVTDQSSSSKALNLNQIWGLIGARLGIPRWLPYVDFDVFEKEMVYIQGGTFTMGCTDEQGGDCDDDEKPHPEDLSSFYLSKYELTQAQWRLIMENDPPLLTNKGCDDCPVDRVSWWDIQSFLKKLNERTGKNYRLPTEAEWEYAARGGNLGSAFKYKYAGSNELNEVAWFTQNAGGLTHPVGRKKPNQLGLFDLSGNVWEFCENQYSKEYHNAPVNDPYYVLRGGAYFEADRGNRVSNRGAKKGNYKEEPGMGFRLALDKL